MVYVRGTPILVPWEGTPPKTYLAPKTHLANPNPIEQWKKLGCLVYIGDEILPSCIGIIIPHYKDPY